MALGYSTWGMPDVPIDEALPRLAAIGYAHVELTVLPRYTTALERLDAAARTRLRELLRATGLALPAVAGHTSLLVPDAATHAVHFARLCATADLCVDLADATPPVLNTTAGGRHEDDWERVRELLVERVGALAEYCRQRGVILAIEPHVGSALSTPERARWLVDTVGSPALRVNFDISHFEAQGLPMDASISLLAPIAVHTHLKDVRGRYPDFEFLLPGEGEFDYPCFFRRMREHGYQGQHTVEVSVMVQRRADYEPFAAAEFCYRTIAPHLAAAGG